MAGLALGFGAGGAAAGGGGIGLAGILSGVTTVLSVVGSLRQAETQALNFEQQAHQAEFDETQQQVEGVRSTTKLKAELLRALGENDVAYAAAGIDLAGGVAESGREAAKKAASQEITVDRATTDAQRAMYRARAAGYYRLASDARSAGLLSAIGAGVSGVGSLVS